jgi:hypothetical protein
MLGIYMRRHGPMARRHMAMQPHLPLDRSYVAIFVNVNAPLMFLNIW